MNFGFDFDGTITAEPDAFREIMAGLISRGNECHVITAAMPSLPSASDRTPAKFESRLFEMGFYKGEHFTRVKVVLVDGAVPIAQGKGEYCAENDMEMVFEDRSDYADEIRKHSRVVMMWPR